MATSITSFWYAIYKRMWAFAMPDDAHTDSTVAGDGNFSLEYSGPPNGIFGTTTYGKPIASGNYVAANNPLWAVLNAYYASPPPAAPGYLVNVPGSGQWPAMPWLAYAPYPVWDKFNDPSNPPRVIDALQHWIEVDHQIDDTPKGTYLDYFGFLKAGSPAFPLQAKPNDQAQILFVPSFPQDNGVRPGNVPATFWDTSLIFVTGTNGQDQGLPVFEPGAEHYIAAVIGNSGNLLSGNLWSQGAPQMTVSCSAYVFSTFLSPGVALPSLHNLLTTDPNTSYEQWYMRALSRDVAGFRFTVDTVYAALKTAMGAFTPAQLGGATPDAWLKAGHCCVKVWITSGEYPSIYNNQGTDYPNGTQSPLANRKIAQRNLAAFDASVMALKVPHWQLFIMSQAGRGANGLAIHTALPASAASFVFAVPTEMYERYIAPGVSKAGGLRGFEPVRDVPAASKPFPDAVLLRQTVPGAVLPIGDHGAEHGADRMFGMALGVELLEEGRAADIAVVHTGADGKTVGGFTLRPQAGRPVRGQVVEKLDSKS